MSKKKYTSYHHHHHHHYHNHHASSSIWFEQLFSNEKKFFFENKVDVNVFNTHTKCMIMHGKSNTLGHITEIRVRCMMKIYIDDWQK